MYLSDILRNLLRMGCGRIFLTIVTICAIAVAGNGSETWHVPNASSRLLLERTKDSPWPAEVGYIEFCASGTTATNVTVVIYTKSGVLVPNEVMWRRAGEQMKILFDCSSKQQKYSVYLVPRDKTLPDAATSSPASWTPEAGVVLETRRYDKLPGTWQDPRTLWHKRAHYYGRSLVPYIHHGIHPHGPTWRFMSYYRAYFDVAKLDDYKFATVSDDSSFIFIDGHIVAKWPGRHGVGGGRRAQQNGTVRLKQGRHKLEYYNMQEDSGFSVAAAWLPPGKKRFEIMPPKAFVPVAHFALKDHTTQKGSPLFKWRMLGHTIVSGMAMVDGEFSVWNPDKEREYTWRFDDGTGDKGPTVKHTFPRQGMRTVSLTSHKKGTKKDKILSVTQRINIQPLWTQRHEWPADVFRRQKKDIMTRDPAAMTITDLHQLLRLAQRIADRDLLSKLGVAAVARQKEFQSDDAQMFLDLATHFQHPSVRKYESTERAFLAAKELAPDGSETLYRIMVHYGGFLIHCRELPAAGRALLDGADLGKLNATDQRLVKIFQGDSFLAEGHVGAARDLYASVGTPASDDDVSYAVRRRMRLEAAKSYLLKGEYDEAEKRIREIEWETPLERLNTETGLAMIQVHIGRKEYTFAASHCHRLLRAAPLDNNNPDILYHLAEVAYAMGNRKHAAETLSALYKKHPYSEATALAKDRWGD